MTGKSPQTQGSLHPDLEAGTETDSTEGWCLVACSPSDLLTFLSTADSLHRDGPTHSGLSHLYRLAVKKMLTDLVTGPSGQLFS